MGRSTKISFEEAFQRKNGFKRSFLPCLRLCLCRSCNKPTIWPDNEVPSTNQVPNYEVPTTNEVSSNQVPTNYEAPFTNKVPSTNEVPPNLTTSTATLTVGTSSILPAHQ